MPIDMYSVWLLLTTLTGSIIIIVLTIFRCVAHTSTQRHVTPKGIMNLLGPSTSVRGLLKSRSLANQRLRHTFNITNTFVQADTQTHNIFVGRMKDLLRAQSRHGQWGGFLRIARQAVASELNRYTIGQEFSTAFADLVQIVTLKAIVVSLLDPDRDMESIDARDLCASATLITELWAMSKQQTSVSSAASSPSTCTPPDVDRLATLSTHLRRLLPDTERYPNPIDFIVPTWETLWRLVATCLAHVYDNKDYRHNFQELLGDPTPGRFRTTSLDLNLCTEWIINETLRLHPPSRHISRSFPVKEHTGLQILMSLLPKFIRDRLRLDSIIRSEIADIESVHLSTDIWGPDALEFKPRRWERHAGAADSAPTLFAFGYGPLMCIGKNWAPMAAALIVGAILEGIDAEGLEIIGTAVIGGRAGWAGWEFKHS